MGYLVLVRHGQSRTFEKESDQLSQLGEEQARMLGKFWIRQSVEFDEIYSGALTRQRRTAEIAGQCFIEAGMRWPELQTLPEFNEYDSNGILNKLVPRWPQATQRFVNWSRPSSGTDKRRSAIAISKNVRGRDFGLARRGVRGRRR